MTAQDARVRRRRRRDGYGSDRGLRPVARYTHRLPYVDDEREAASSLWQCGMTRIAHDGPGCLCTAPTDVGRILRTFKIKKNVEVTDNGKIII